MYNSNVEILFILDLDYHFLISECKSISIDYEKNGLYHTKIIELYQIYMNRATFLKFFKGRITVTNINKLIFMKKRELFRLPTVQHFEIPADDIERRQKFYKEVFG